LYRRHAATLSLRLYSVGFVSAILLHTGAVKLGGVGPGYAGRFMIKYGGIWGTVSDDNFDDDDAKVACYMLGFGYVRLKVFQA